MNGMTINERDIPRMSDEDVAEIADFLSIDVGDVRAVLMFHTWFLTGRFVAPHRDAQARYGAVEDGFGSEWLRCGEACDLQVVRPGKAQCNATDEGCPNGSTEKDCCIDCGLHRTTHPNNGCVGRYDNG